MDNYYELSSETSFATPPAGHSNEAAYYREWNGVWNNLYGKETRKVDDGAIHLYPN